MNKITVSILPLMLGVSLSFNTSAANVWSGCHTVTSVSDNRAHDGALYIGISPAIPTCTYGGIQRVRIMPGQNNATQDTVTSGIALTTAAMVSSKLVQFYYDDATVECNVRIVSFGGYAGQCQ